MSALRGKAFRDLWRQRGRVSLVVLAMAAGLVAFVSVLATFAILDRELNEGYLATNPASVVIRVSRLDAGALEAVAEVAGVQAVEPRWVFSGRIRTERSEWRDLRLFVIEDFARVRVARVTPQEGQWPPLSDQILLERDAVGVAGAETGDIMTIRLQDRELTMRMGGTVHDPGQAQARMERMVYGYVSRSSLEDRAGVAADPRILVLTEGNRFDRSRNREIAERVQSLLASRGVTVTSVEVPVPGEHPHAQIMGLLLLSQAAFGLFALVLSGVLVFNLMSALLRAQYREIGIMKSLGGSPERIGLLFVGEALLIGCLAAITALPLQIVATKWLCEVMAGFLNFDLASLRVPWWVGAAELAVVLLLPLLAAGHPIIRASRLRVRDVLNDAGVADRSFGRSWADRLIFRLKGPSRPVLLGIRNAFRRRGRLTLTVLTLVAGGSIYLVAMNVRAGLLHTVDAMFGAMKFDVMMTLESPRSVEEIESLLAPIRQVASWEGWITTRGSFPDQHQVPAATAQTERPRGHLATATRAAGHGDTFQVLAVPDHSRMIELDIVEGRTLAPGDTNAMVINSRLAGLRPQMSVGSEVEVRLGHRPMKWRIVGRTRETFAGPAAYVPLAFLASGGGLGGRTNSLRIAVDERFAVSDARRAIDRVFGGAGVEVVAASSVEEIRIGYREHMVMIYRFLILMGGAILTVGGFGLLSTMSLSVLERRREIGVLRALGAGSPTIFVINGGEALAIGLGSWIVSAALAWPMTQLVSNLLMHLMFRSGLEPRSDLGAVVALLVTFLILAAIASLSATWQTLRQSVREAVSYE